jgi:hypothetical protein
MGLAFRHRKSVKYVLNSFGIFSGYENNKGHIYIALAAWLLLSRNRVEILMGRQGSLSIEPQHE